MNILDLFSGTGGWHAAARPSDHVVSIELDDRFTATHHLDVGDTDAVLAVLGAWRPDLLLASPPCSSFSTMSMGRMWTHENEPKHPTAVEGKRLVLATLTLVEVLRPSYWVLENPMARLRTSGFLDGIEVRTVSYCHLGLDRQKMTDLFGVFPPGLELPDKCHNRPGENGRPHPADCCCADHIAAPRGSRGGTQGGVSTTEAGAIPRQLSELVIDAADAALSKSRSGELEHRRSTDREQDPWS